MPKFVEGQYIKNDKTGQIAQMRDGKAVIINSDDPKLVAYTNAIHTGRVEKQAIDRAREQAQNPLATGMIGEFSAGTKSRPSDFFRGSASLPGGVLNSRLHAIRSGEFLGALAALKNASKNGASGLGAVQGREQTALENRVADLNVGLPQKEILSNLGYIDTNINQILPGIDPSNPIDMTGIPSRRLIPKEAYYKDAQGNVRRNDNFDKGNPIVPGYAAKAAKALSASQGAGVNNLPNGSYDQRLMGDADAALEKLLKPRKK